MGIGSMRGEQGPNLLCQEASRRHGLGENCYEH
jgi:hypothetical protein